MIIFRSETKRVPGDTGAQGCADTSLSCLLSPPFCFHLSTAPLSLCFGCYEKPKQLLKGSSCFSLVSNGALCLNKILFLETYWNLILKSLLFSERALQH